ncbi:glycine--tRNA ligase subunit beta [Acidisphaera sp. S103]|uniref:glycine--tRNA ligase subunit beta n=1 Tax=Acidisphaera sp. S103 TaxID=1747223 RepID=UPI00131C03F9|nr:glycine--tRNA ligase subunit beta [Acidisphaera sp. S103]
MPEFFLELFSEEIPARMQRGAAAELERAIGAALAAVAPGNIATWFGPRRIAWRADVSAEVAAASSTERGPRASAPEQALTGFLRKHNANREQLRQEGDYWVLEKSAAAVSAGALIASVMPGLLRRFPWPKSMRWGGSSGFVWVRPLRRIVCLLDGAVVPFDLRDGSDDGHGLASGDLTEGHRFHAPGAFAVSSAADWRDKLAAHRVLVDAVDRKRIIADRIAGLAAEKHLAVVDDPGLLDEVAGLVEWPVPHLGRIADEHMDLPPEVMQVSMRVNQRYFALRTAEGAAAPWFAFVANVEADDHGTAIIAGNERVLRARFSDARHFWDLDRKTRLETRIPALDKVTFQAKLGTQGDRVRRLVQLAATIAEQVGADPAQAALAAELAKADLVSGMVGEFPELQGVMGRYYALHDGEIPAVADAVRDHYAPRGPTEPAPSAPVSIAVALADKLDQLAGFFAIGEKPTGSGDPYALRRAALGVIRIIRENGLRVHTRRLLTAAASDPATVQAVFEFIVERLVVQLRADGARYDVLNAVFGAKGLDQDRDDDLVALLARTEAVASLLGTPDGANLLTAYRRAANILRIEERKDGPFTDVPDPALFREQAEIDLDRALANCHGVAGLLNYEAYGPAMGTMASLRAPLDAFFEKVTVNAPEPDLRRNRLRLLNQVRSIMDQIADFSRIEG